MSEVQRTKSEGELPLIVFATIKTWNLDNVARFKDYWKEQYRVEVISNPEQLSYELLETLKPAWVFFPHWSWIVSANIHQSFRCVVFHITDLPFGRGGSPLQNLITRRIYQTKICALQMSEEVDSGPIYMKHDLDISLGSATEIYHEISDIIFTRMIPEILKDTIKPEDQIGEITHFRRLNFDSGNFNKVCPKNLDVAYDLIRMLDAEGYPSAFVTVGKLKVELQNVKRDGKRKLKGEFVIYENEDIGSGSSS